MKNILLTTTALAMTAGAAAAGEITLSAGGNMGLKFADGSDTESHMEANFTVGGSLETDNGLTVSMSSAITSSDGSGPSDNDHSVSVSGAFGKLSMGGAVSEADAIGGMADLGFDGLGVDDIVDSLDGIVAHNVNYSTNMGAVALGLSTDMGGNSGAIGIKYNLGGLTLGVGHAEHGSGYTKPNVVATQGVALAAGGAVTGTVDVTGTATADTSKNDSSVTNATISGSMGNISFQASTSTQDFDAVNLPDITTFGVSASFSMDALTITLMASDSDAGTDAAGVGFAYSLGGGASIKGAVADVNGTSKGDLGLTFSF